MSSIGTSVLGMFGGSSITMYVVIGLGVALLITGAFAKYEMSQNEQKAGVITALKISVDQQKKVIVQLQSDAHAIEVITHQLDAMNAAASEQAVNLATKLTKLDKVAVEKPKEVEAIINKASLDRNRCMALVTGAIKLKDEKNSVCPQVIERK